MKITIISVGKIKEKYLKQGIDEYTKRLNRYTKINFIEIPDEKAPENLSQAQMEQIKTIEGDKILAKCPKDSFCFALAIQGKQYTSEELASTIKQLTVHGNSHLTFIIGGSLGLSNKVLQHSDQLLSFSKMTFPHQLMKLILTEQIYRSFRINNNEPYHK